MKLTPDDKVVLLDMGYEESDFRQIEEATRRTIYRYDGRKIKLEEVIALIGRRDFLSGVARSAFHYSAGRDTQEGKQVYFDSSRIFRDRGKKK